MSNISKNARNRWSEAIFVKGKSKELHALFDGPGCTGPHDMQGIVVGMTGSLETLMYTGLFQKAVSDIDFSFAKFSCSFSKSQFEKVNFFDCSFDTCDMIKSCFSQCSFEKAVLCAPRFDDSEIIDCSFAGCRLRGRGIKEYGGRRVIFKNCNFSDAEFKGLEFRAATFSNCNFKGCVFRKCLLIGAKFEGTALEPDQLIGCKDSA